MPNKKTTPEKNTEKKVDKISSVTDNKTSSIHKTPHKKPSNSRTSPRRTVNLFMLIIMLIITTGIYLHQKGYITKYYPIVKSKFAHSSPIVPPDIPHDIAAQITQTKENNNKTNGLSSLDSSSNSASSSNIETSSGQIISQTNLPIHPPTALQENTQHIKKLQERIQSLEGQLDAISNTSSAKTTESSPQLDKVFLKDFSVLQDLFWRIKQGLPFIQELNAANEILSQENQDILKEYASLGVPTLSYLLLELKAVERIIRLQEEFKTAPTFVEKATALLKQLVHVEKINKTDQDKTKMLKQTARKIRMMKGDTSFVISEIESYKNENERVSQWITHAKSYDAAQTILIKTKQTLFNTIN